MITDSTNTAYNNASYNNVFTFPDGVPYNMTAGSALVFSIVNMHNGLDDINEVFERLISSLITEL